MPLVRNFDGSGGRPPTDDPAPKPVICTRSRGPGLPREAQGAEPSAKQQTLNTGPRRLPAIPESPLTTELTKLLITAANHDRRPPRCTRFLAIKAGRTGTFVSRSTRDDDRMKAALMTTAFRDLLAPERLTDVVDIGANPIDGEPPYTPLLNSGLCRVTGFEPQAEALAALQAKKGPYERYLPYAVGDGGEHTLNICRGSGMTSFYEPDPATLGLFEVLQPYGEVIDRVPMSTQKLDDVPEIEHIDYLKIDIQGGELAAFQGGRSTLADTVAIQTEVSFVTLYRDQPTMGDIDVELRGQGFIPHCFAAVKRWPIAPMVVNNDPRWALNQLLEADIVYVRDFARPDSMSDEQLKHLALISHHCYGSFDLALRCVMLLEQRGSLKPGTQRQYLSLQAG